MNKTPRGSCCGWFSHFQTNKKMNEPSRLTYGHQLYFLLLQEVQRHGHVLQLHLADDGPGVVLAVHLLVAEDLQQGDEPQAIAQVVLQVAHPLVDALEMLVDPAGEGVLLDLFPRGVVTQVSLGDRHLGGVRLLLSLCLLLNVAQAGPVIAVSV